MGGETEHMADDASHHKRHRHRVHDGRADMDGGLSAMSSGKETASGRKPFDALKRYAPSLSAREGHGPASARILSQGFVSKARGLMDGGLTLVLAWMLAGLFWDMTGLNTPDALTGSPAFQRGNGSGQPLAVAPETLRGFNPFSRQIQSGPATATGSSGSGEATVTAAPETMLDLTLYGIRRATAPNRRDGHAGGSAIVRTPDGKEKAYTIGEELIDGVTLAAIYGNHVEISRQGTRESLFFENAARPGAPRVIQAAGQTRRPAADSARGEQTNTRRAAANALSARDFESLMASVTFTPRRDGRRITGWIMRPTGPDGYFTSLGFRAGDILIAVNGDPVNTAEILSELTAEISGKSNLVIRVERDGVAQNLSFEYSG